MPIRDGPRTLCSEARSLGPFRLPAMRPTHDHVALRKKGAAYASNLQCLFGCSHNLSADADPTLSAPDLSYKCCADLLTSSPDNEQLRTACLRVDWSTFCPSGKGAFSDVSWPPGAS